jgi:hypothetical protein
LFSASCRDILCAPLKGITFAHFVCNIANQPPPHVFSFAGEGGDDRDDSLLDLSTIVARRQRTGSDAGAGAASGGGASVANAIFGPGPDSPAGPVGMAGPNIGGVDGLSYSQEVRHILCFGDIVCKKKIANIELFEFVTAFSRESHPFLRIVALCFSPCSTRSRPCSLAGSRRHRSVRMALPRLRALPSTRFRSPRSTI